MKTRTVPIAALALSALALAAFAANPPPAATVTAKKGPLQLTLRLYKTSVKKEKALWYEIELKNVGKKRILLMDRIFRDPWAMHANVFHRDGIYLDITAPPGLFKHAGWPSNKRDGKSPPLRLGAGRVKRDWQDMDYSPKEQKELAALEAKWAKQGLSESEKVDKRSLWRQMWVMKKESDEDTDPARMAWLEPGASTRTFAWAYRDPDTDAPHGGKFAEWDDEENQIGDYTQLWSYDLYIPGKYRIRAVYNNSLGKPDGKKHAPWYIEFNTPQIEFEVLP